ncbi:SAS053 family DNA gyrase inhibitor [Staphylococcus sp. 17KM0847]|uniref:SAS053 family DNA gyrase inhibitor n=1 Tax=Staphylococcus sp. 17KM0847 TaxID=2583989 RepID=UPI0015DEDDC4
MLEKKEHDNEMVESFDDVVELGKEMEQISEANDEEKYDQSHKEIKPNTHD